jgi:hypothetical protein
MQEEEKQESIPGNSRDERPELPLLSESGCTFLLKNFVNNEFIFPDLKLSKTLQPVYSFFHPPKDFSAFLKPIA